MSNVLHVRAIFFCTFNRPFAPCVKGERFVCEDAHCDNAVCEEHAKFVRGHHGRTEMICPECATGKQVAE